MLLNLILILCCLALVVYIVNRSGIGDPARLIINIVCVVIALFLVLRAAGIGQPLKHGTGYTPTIGQTPGWVPCFGCQIKRGTFNFAWSYGDNYPNPNVDFVNRYVGYPGAGQGVQKWAGFDNEQGNVNDAALMWACQQGRWGTGWDCHPTQQESIDLRSTGDLSIIHEWYLATQDGAVPERPVDRSDPAQPCGVFAVKDAYGGVWLAYYRNTAPKCTQPQPTPSPVPSATPTPSPTASPTPPPPQATPTPCPTPVPPAPPAVGITPACKQLIHALAGKSYPSLLTWGMQRAAAVLECKATVDALPVVSPTPVPTPH